MNDTPKRWLIEYDGELYVMNGFADALAAVKTWADTHGLDPDRVKVTELHTETLDVYIRRVIEAEYR